MKRLVAMAWIPLLGSLLLAGCGSSRAVYCNACIEGHMACDPAGMVVVCEGPDSDGCLRWAPPRPKKTGECQDPNPCQAGDQVCDSQGETISCLGPNADGNTYWSTAEQCPAGQSCNPAAASCLDNPPESCAGSNECSYIGQMTCMSLSKYRECKKGDDGCLVWDCST